MNLSLRWRITLIALVISSLFFGAWNIFFSNWLTRYAQNALQNDLLNQAHIIASFLIPPEGNSLDASLVEKIPATIETKNYSSIAVLLSDGSIVFRSPEMKAPAENYLELAETIKAFSGEDGIQIRSNPPDPQKYIFIAVPIQKNQKILGSVHLTQSLQMVASATKKIRFINTIISFAAVVMFTLLAWWMGTRISRRIIYLSASIPASPETSLPFQSIGDEIDFVEHSMNHYVMNANNEIERLQKNEEIIQNVISRLTDAVIIADKNGLVQMVNPAALTMFEISREAAVGHSLVQTVRHHQLIDLWQKSLSTGQQQSATLETSTDRLFIQGIATPLQSGHFGDTLLVFQDLTRVRRLETVRRDFVSNVSHELRTPLAALKSLTETLNEGALEDPPAARKFLQRMDSEIDNMTQIVQELLELSRIESGKVPLNLKPVLPSQLVSQTIERMFLQAQRANITLKNSCPADLPPVMVDSARIGQVMMNLIHNAIKFTPPGGKITVSAVQEEHQVIFKIEDSGVGISPEALDRIFERFFKADRARSGGGTGLGLSIARHLVETHQGKIWAESTPGIGSIFYFSLPVAI